MDIQSIPTEIAFLTLIDRFTSCRLFQLIKFEQSARSIRQQRLPIRTRGTVPRLFDGFSAFDPAVRVASAFPKGMAVKISDRIVPDQNFRLIIASCFFKCKIYFGGF